MDGPAELHLGDYLVRPEGDVMFVRAHGVVRPEIARGLVRVVSQIMERHGRIFILCDLRQAGPMPPESRRIFVEFGASHPPVLALAFYHVSLMVRGVNALLFSAINLVSKRPHNMRQFSSEQDARSWLAAERARLVPGK